MEAQQNTFIISKTTTEKNQIIYEVVNLAKSHNSLYLSGNTAQGVIDTMNKLFPKGWTANWLISMDSN